MNYPVQTVTMITGLPWTSKTCKIVKTSYHRSQLPVNVVSLRADGNDRKQNEKKANEKEDEGSEIVEEESSEIHQEDEEEEDDEEEDADDENKTEKEGDEDNEQEDWSESDLDEEPEKFATLKEFYQLEKGANAFHSLLVMFFRHLQDLNGGACKERQAMLHA